MPAAAQILCVKCGAASPTPRLECAKCGGRNARVCGGCGNQNSVAKNFCDKCGLSISDLSQAAPPPKQQLSGSPSADIPATEVRRLPIPGAGSVPPPGSGSTSGPLPSVGKPSPAFSAPLDDLWSAPAPAPLAPAAVSRQRRNLWRGMLNTVAALAGVAAAAYGIWTWRQNQDPDILVPKLGAKYLEALRTHDYAGAYALFSAAAKKNCTVDELRASRDATEWTWSGMRVEYKEPGAILLAYELDVAGAPPRQDHLLFTQEGERWTRPYNWTLMRRTVEAFDKKDPDKALLLAQTAATVNPRDPMAWGYLCQAAYFRKAPQDAESRCARALELARTYPSSMTPQSLYHLHAILADTYDHALRSPDRALEQYAEMLAFSDISPADQCQILIARSQLYGRISRPGEALSDLDRAAQLCDPRDRPFIQKMRDNLRAP